MKKSQVLPIYDLLASLSKLTFDETFYPGDTTAYTKWQKFLYALIKNETVLAAEKAIIDKLVAPSEKTKEFLGKRDELIKQYGDKDENGQLKIVNQSVSFTAHRAEWDSALSALFSEYKEVIEAENTRTLETQQILNTEDADITVAKIKYENIPLTKVSFEQIKLLGDIVDFSDMDD